MRDDDIDELIAEVQALRIRVTQLESERDKHLPVVNAVNVPGGTRPRDSFPTNQTPSRAATNDRAAQRATIIAFAPGDRVRIKNRVRKPATWPGEVQWNEERERIATVTKIIAEQVHFVTDNGTHTWRAQNNLQKLTNDE